MGEKAQWDSYGEFRKDGEQSLYVIMIVIRQPHMMTNPYSLWKMCGIAGNIGGELNLLDWRFATLPLN